MNNYICLICISLMFMLGCQSPSSNEATLSDDHDVVLESDSFPRFTIPVKSAQEDILRYAKLMNRYDSILGNAKEPVLLNSPLRSFTIRSTDLVEALGMKMRYEDKAKFKYVRVYIGLDPSDEFKLFLTPVVDADLDSHPPQAGRDHVLQKKVKDQSDASQLQGYVMDFAMPCPKTCPQLTLTEKF